MTSGGGFQTKALHFRKFCNAISSEGKKTSKDISYKKG